MTSKLRGTSSFCVLLFLSAAACSDLQPIEANVCGNKLREPAGEECDGEPGCGLPGEPGACRYTCTAPFTCPENYTCGLDEICRQHSGAFRVVRESDDVTLLAQAGDLDGDGRADVLRTSNDRAEAEFYDDDFNLAVTSLDLEPEGVAPLVAPLTFDDSGIPDAQLDLALSVEVGGDFGSGLAVYRSQNDRSLSGTSYAAITIEDATAIQGMTISAVEPLNQRQVMAFARFGPMATQLVGLDEHNLPFSFIVPDDPTGPVPLAPDWLSGVAVGQLFGGNSSPCEEIAFADGHVPPEIDSTFDYQRKVYVLEPCAITPDGADWNMTGPRVVVVGNLPAKVRHNTKAGPSELYPGLYSSLFLADWEGDGDQDILVVLNDDDHPLHLILNDDPMTATFLAAEPVLDVTQTGDLAAIALNHCTDDVDPMGEEAGTGIILGIADFDGDGAQDILTDDSLWVGETLVEDCLGWSNAVVADFDDNGTLDIVASRYREPGLEVALGAGDGTFSFSTVSTESEVFLLRAGDYDGDFVTDLAYVELEEVEVSSEGLSTTDRVSVLFGATSGGFDAPHELGTLDTARQILSGRVEGGDATDELVALTGGVQARFALAFFLGSASRHIVSPFLFDELEMAGTRRFAVVDTAAGNFFTTDPKVGVAVLTQEGGEDGPQDLWRLGVSGEAELEKSFDRRVPGIERCGDQCMLAPVDLDGDAVDELVVLGDGLALVHASAGESGPVFDETAEVATDELCFSGEDYVEPLIEDVDGDDLRDIVTLADALPGCDGDAKIVVLWNDGDGTIHPDSSTRIVNGDAKLTLAGYALIDLDNDGQKELIASGMRPKGFGKVAAGETRAFTLAREPEIDFAEGAVIAVDGDGFDSGALTLVAADFNGDGVRDLAASQFHRYVLLAGIPHAMNKRHGWLSILLAVCVWLSLPANAVAQEDRARELFNAGVAAYKDGQFVHAAQAFLEAHELVHKPQLLFSAAQAFRRQYDAEGGEMPLRMAVKYYSAYLGEVKEGGRRADASRALADLKPLLGAGDSGAEMKFATRVSITAPVAHGVVSIDGGPWLAVPHNGEISAGPHKVVVRASGYFDGAREFVAQEGSVSPVDVPMRGKPPRLQVVGADGADVAVDGQVIGSAPFGSAAPVRTGRHFVAVTATGHKPYSAELEFGYGSTTTIEVDLPSTNQRRAAWGVLVGGAGALIAAGVLGGLALAAEEEAKDIEADQAAGPIDAEAFTDHNKAIDRRDRLRVASGVVAGVGGAIALSGLFMILFDEPVVTPPMERSEDEDTSTPADEQPTDMEVMAGASPDGFGVVLSGRF